MRRYVRESDASPEKTVALEHHALESGALRPAAPTARRTPGIWGISGKLEGAKGEIGSWLEISIASLRECPCFLLKVSLDHDPATTS